MGIKYTNSRLLTLLMLHTNFGKDWVSSSRRCKRNTALHDDGRQAIAMGHLSEPRLIYTPMIKIEMFTVGYNYCICYMKSHHWNQLFESFGVSMERRLEKH